MTINFNNTVDNFANEFSSLSSITLTYGKNGYPSFGGENRIAFYGFDCRHMEDIREIARKYDHASIHCIYWKNGWDLAEDRGEANTLIMVDPEDLCEELSEFNTDDTMYTEALKDIASDCEGDTLKLEEEIGYFLKNLREVNDAYELAKDDEMVLVRGLEYDRTIQRSVATLHRNSRSDNFAIAIVFNSSDFEENL